MSVVFDPRNYEQMSDGDLMRIAIDRAELTPEALAALEAQLSARGLGEAQQREFASTYRAQVAAEEREQVSKSVRNFQSRRGIGTAFYGRRDLKEMNNREQYQATRWFCIFWIPLIPLGTYIVHRTTTTWLGLFDDVRTLRKVPLDWEQVFKTWAVAALVLAGIYFLGPWLLFWWVKR
jgi:hypothetical protein